jgi:hypothetical protein
VNGESAVESYAVPWSDPQPTQTLLSGGHYFVMGDNRPNSVDSRNWGPLRREQIVGRARAVFWSVAGRRSDPAANAAARRLSVPEPPAVRWRRVLSSVR